VFLPGGRTAAKIHQPLIHMAGYATIDRHAISGSAETIPGQQLIRLRTPLPYRGAYTGVALASYPWPAILASYDYVWGYNLPRDFAAFLGRNCEVVAEAGLGRLYRTRPHRR